jgi:hypothetical protein
MATDLFPLSLCLGFKKTNNHSGGPGTSVGSGSTCGTCGGGGGDTSGASGAAWRSGSSLSGGGPGASGGLVGSGRLGGAGSGDAHSPGGAVGTRGSAGGAHSGTSLGAHSGPVAVSGGPHSRGEVAAAAGGAWRWWQGRSDDGRCAASAAGRRQTRPQTVASM